LVDSKPGRGMGKLCSGKNKGFRHALIGGSWQEQLEDSSGRDTGNKRVTLTWGSYHNSVMVIPNSEMVIDRPRSGLTQLWRSHLA
jgi:hypothetical protein